MRKWFMFMHTDGRPNPADDKRPEFRGAHLVETDGLDTAANAKPLCDMAGARCVAWSELPRGFLVACIACLARSECPQ